MIISNKPPYPIIDGGCFAMAKFEQLAQQCFSELFYFAISTPKHPFNEKQLPKEWSTDSNFYSEFIDTRIQNKHVVKYFAGSSIRASRFYSSAVEKKILQLIEAKKIEVVIFESIYAAVYLKSIKKIPGVKVFIRAHNIEHQIWEKYFETMPRGLKRLAFKSETSRLQSFEEACLAASDGNIFISQKDLDFCSEQNEIKKAFCLPVQLNIRQTERRTNLKPLKLFHLGAMDWAPNKEGIENFLLNIFPSIVKSFPDIELHLAGKAMPDSFKHYQSPNVFMHGQVDDAAGFIEPYDVLIVPIESGSGLRIKILESMAAGKPVITTSVGIAGINAENKKEYLLANQVDEWIKAIEYLNDVDQYNQMVTNAKLLVERTYSEKALLEKLKYFFHHQMNP